MKPTPERDARNCSNRMFGLTRIELVAPGSPPCPARRGSCRRAPEAIPGTANRLHQRIMPRGFERLPQPAYVHVHRPLLDEDVIAPDLVEQLGAAVDALRMGDE